jgi:hypothetical protein
MVVRRQLPGLQASHEGGATVITQPETWHVPEPLVAVLVGLAVLGALMLVGGARRAARDTGRAVSLVGRVLLYAAGTVAVQWMVLTRSSNTTLQLVVLGLPALLAAALVTRALTITTTTRRGGRR